MPERTQTHARSEHVEVADWFTSLPAREDDNVLAEYDAPYDDDIFAIDFAEYDMVSIRESLERSPYLHGRIVA